MKWKAITFLIPETVIGGYLSFVTAEEDGLGFDCARFDMQNGEDLFNLTGVDLEAHGEKPESN